MEQCGDIITARAGAEIGTIIEQIRRQRRYGAALLLLPCLAPDPSTAQTATPAPLEDRAQALECLALAIAYEAGYESAEGQQAVAEVVLNRVRTPGFPKSVCGVVFAGSLQKTGCQFTFTCDGSLRRRLPDRILQQARSIAEQVLDGRRATIVGNALNYHAAYVSPYWAPTLQRVTRIGLHIFYARPSGSPAAETAPIRPGPTAPSAPPQAFAPWGLRPAPPAETR
jgi:hypothetical protein